MNRMANFISDKIIDHFTELERPFLLLPEDVFDDEYGNELQARYGWTLPHHGAFCVSRIAQQTAHLPLADLIDYMRAMLWIVDRHIVVAHEQPDLDALSRHHLIESELYEKAPASMKLMSRVEMQALDST